MDEQVEAGLASWYGVAYKGRRTASGERFDPADLTSAHPSLPFGTVVEVTNRLNGRRVAVVVTDRGPGGGRIIDVSDAAARRLGMKADGTVPVEIRIIGSAEIAAR
ncbi:MAG: septal ring lytic transglycosylase RlpA family protein [Actinomycetota bacterium]